MENVALSGYIEKIDKIIVYKWNRRYPADFYMDIPLIKNGWQLVENYDFKGYSHEKITEEVYER